MEITEVRVKLVDEQSERVKAFCSVTLDKEFVIRDLKIIEGTSGLFLAMPSRKLADRCPKCSSKNHLRAKFCNFCGTRLVENRAPRDEQGRAKLHADVAHPINTACREMMQTAVVEAFNRELERSLQPGYMPAQLDEEYEASEFDDFIEDVRESVANSRERPPAAHPAAASEGGTRRAQPATGRTSRASDEALTSRFRDVDRKGRPVVPAQKRSDDRGPTQEFSETRQSGKDRPVRVIPPPERIVPVAPPAPLPPVSRPIPAVRKDADEDTFGAGIV